MTLPTTNGRPFDGRGWDCYCGWEGDEDGAIEHFLATGHDPLGVAAGRFLSEVVWDAEAIKKTLRPIALIEHGHIAREWDGISARDVFAIWKLARLLNGMAVRRPAPDG